ncbi:MAG TPA: L-threonylcarbamoyladenylate synthase [Candidatus Hydrogenedens sp.]|jgi:L-threonylcarbamoyladenylate synthase|nr:L-threonylcarbamoyladenylate synthase [Candidatus Hydrogenedens sp.]
MLIVQADNRGIQKAVIALNNNEIVAYPTETVYGLAVNPFSEEAVEKLFRLKGREENKPVLLVIGSLMQLDEVVISVSEKAKICIEKFWPGPLSLVLPSVSNLSQKLTAGKGKICVRWSSHPVAQKLALAFGHAITSTSANRSGESPARNILELPSDGISIAIEDISMISSEVSTVFDPDTGEIFREGVIKKSQLQQILN